MKANSFLCRIICPAKFHLAAVSLILFSTLAWSSLAFGGKIHDAAGNGDLEKVKALLKDNPNLVFSKDNGGETPLHWAADGGHKDVAELLLANKAEVNAIDNNGRTPLHYAAENGDAGMTKLLLDHKADANAKDKNGKTPLHVARNSDVAELLLDNKADVNSKDKSGNTPLHTANNDFGVAHLLRQHGGVDLFGDFCLYVESGNLVEIKALLKDYPDLISSKDDSGARPLHWAAITSHKDAAELLLANKANVNAKDNAGKTPLYVAASQGYGGFVGAFEGREDVAELLITSGADVNAKDDAGETPLSAAADSGFKYVAELLLANKADVNAKTAKGETALFKAVSGGYKDVAELLLANKADVNAKTHDGNTPLYEAVRQNRKDLTELLLANKADVNIKDNHGQTPLHWAANKGMAELLLTNKAHVNAEDNKGETPLHDAVKGGRKDVAELLSRHGGQDRTKRTALVNFRGLKGFQWPDGTLLITSGFPYDKELQVEDEIEVGDSGNIEKLLFYKILAAEQLSPDGKHVYHPVNTAVGLRWKFKKALTSFRVGEYVYTALREGSTVAFTEEGVYLSDIKITPLSAYKKR